MTDLRFGSVLGGRLRVDRELGRGGMGVVYEATDLSLGRRVAVKVMAEDLARDPDQKRRFEREARAVAKLSSEHVVRVLEISETDEGTPYMVLELLAGQTLEAILEERGPLPVATAVGWVRQALAALREAHGAGLVHRDLKPANLFLAERPGRPPIVKVLDFGVVKDVRSVTANLTKTGDALGTPAYMAPEQVRAGERVDASTDVWAVGVTLYELLTKELPFEARSVAAILQAILEAPAVPVRRRRADVPEELEAVLARCLAKRGAERFANAAELDDALASAIALGAKPAPRPSSPSSPAPAEASALPAPSPPAPSPPEPPRAPTRRSVRPPRRGPNSGVLFAIAFLGALTTGVVAIVAYVLTQSPPDRAPVPPTREREPLDPDASTAPLALSETEGDADVAAQPADAASAPHARGLDAEAPRATQPKAQVQLRVRIEPRSTPEIDAAQLEKWRHANERGWLECVGERSCTFATRLTLLSNAKPRTSLRPAELGERNLCPFEFNTHSCVAAVAANAHPKFACEACATRVTVFVGPGNASR